VMEVPDASASVAPSAPADIAATPVTPTPFRNERRAMALRWKPSSFSGEIFVESCSYVFIRSSLPSDPFSMCAAFTLEEVKSDTSERNCADSRPVWGETWNHSLNRGPNPLNPELVGVGPLISAGCSLMC
jgi:hypothetical protein